MNTIPFSMPGFGAKLPIVHQSEAAECGLACLAMVAAYHGYRTDLALLRKRFPVSLKGSTLQALIGTATALGLAARPVRAEMGALRTLHTPAVLHWNMNHFVVLARATKRYAILHDPARGVRNCRLWRFRSILPVWRSNCGQHRISRKGKRYSRFA